MNAPPNTALQRTRSAPLRSPLSCGTLGGRTRFQGGGAMVKRFVALGTLLLLSCAPSATIRRSGAEAEITRLLQAWRDARVAGDTAFLGRFYAEELRIQGTNGAVIT